MAQMMDIPVLGVIENYSYLVCPDCGKHISVFGESGIDETAKELGISVLGKLPMNPEYAAKVDAGQFHTLEVEGVEQAIETLKQMK